MLLISAPVPARVDAARVLVEVDRRERPDLVVEDDRERTGVPALVARDAADLAAHRLVLRDLLEDLVAVPGERRRTIGWPFGSKSWRTPDSFRSLPVMFGYLPSVAYWSLA